MMSSNSHFSACQQGDLGAVRLIAKADINDRNENREHCLLIASRAGHLAVLDYLLSEGSVDLNTNNKKGQNALMVAADGKIASSLIKAGMNVNKVSSGGWTALMWAAYEGRITVVYKLVKKHANIHLVDGEGKTALIRAAEKGHVDVVRYLADKGANVHVMSKDGSNSLMWAAGAKHLSVVSFLVEQKVDLKLINKRGYTALMMAAGISKNHAVLQYLLEHDKSNIDQQDQMGLTALTLAAAMGHLDNVKVLVSAGANLNLTTKKGHSAAMLAAQSGQWSMIHYLAYQGADLSLVDDNGDDFLALVRKDADRERLRDLLQTMYFEPVVVEVVPSLPKEGTVDDSANVAGDNSPEKEASVSNAEQEIISAVEVPPPVHWMDDCIAKLGSLQDSGSPEMSLELQKVLEVLSSHRVDVLSPPSCSTDNICIGGSAASQGYVSSRSFYLTCLSMMLLLVFLVRSLKSRSGRK